MDYFLGIWRRGLGERAKVPGPDHPFRTESGIGHWSSGIPRGRGKPVNSAFGEVGQVQVSPCVAAEAGG